MTSTDCNTFTGLILLDKKGKKAKNISVVICKDQTFS